MARDKKKWLYIAQIRANHLPPEVVAELRRRSAAHNTTITEEVIRIVTAEIGGSGLVIARDLARVCRNCGNTGYDATESDGQCHVVNCPRDEARRALTEGGS